MLCGYLVDGKPPKHPNAKIILVCSLDHENIKVSYSDTKDITFNLQSPPQLSYTKTLTASPPDRWQRKYPLHSLQISEQLVISMTLLQAEAPMLEASEQPSCQPSNEAMNTLCSIVARVKLAVLGVEETRS